MNHRALIALAVLLVAALAAACGGSVPPPATATPQPSQPGSSGVPGSAVPPGQGGTSPAPSVPGGPALDLGGAAQALEGIDSYRISINMEGQVTSSFEAVVIRKPEPAQSITVTSGPTPQKFIVIGSEAWLESGPGVWTPVPAQMAAGLASGFDPIFLIQAYNSPAFIGGVETVGPEERNGVQTTHYRATPSTLQGQFASLPPTAQVDFWIAADGYLVSFDATDFSGPDTKLSVDVSNINDPANVVERPD